MIDILNEIFDQIDELKTTSECPPIYNITQSNNKYSFFRARRAPNEKNRIKIALCPEKELGPPPSYRAVSGRMNPSGISFFYAAFQRETCLAELRLPVGEFAISGEFKLEKQIKVLDLTVFNKIYEELSLFDPNYLHKANRIDFLEKFGSEVTKPILKQNEDALEAIPTQVFVEYIANHFKSKIDAIIYSSTQTNGKMKNIVLLNHASQIKGFKKNSQNQNRSTEECIESFDHGFGDYCIFINASNIGSHPVDNDDDSDDMNCYLSFVSDSLRIHEINEVVPKFKSHDIGFFDLS